MELWSGGDLEAWCMHRGVVLEVEAHCRCSIVEI